MTDSITHFIFPVIQHFQEFSYWIAFFAALVETTFLIGLFIPGSTLLLLLGAFSASGHIDFASLLYFAIAGAIIGDNLNYWLGKHYGQHWIHDGAGFIKTKHIENTQDFLDRHGARSIFLGRFVPGIKELIPFVAGTVKMRRPAFMFWNVLGATGWGLEWLGAGYLFARSINLAQLWLSRMGLLLAILFVLSLLLLWLRHFIFRYGQQWLHFLNSVWHSIRTAIANNSDVTRLIQDHPRLFSFLTVRLNKQHFSGLPLTLLSLAFLYVLALFGGIVEDLISRDPLVAVDHSLAQLIAMLRTAETVQFFIWMTELGAWQLIIAFTLISMTILWLVQRQQFIAGLLTAVSGSIVFTTLGKIAFHRPRPVEAVLLENSYSFPSGHATIAVAFYGFLAYILIRSSDTWKHRVNLFFACLVLILLIGLSRIMLGVHYLSDVLGGYLIGALWLIIGISLSEWLNSKTVKLPDNNRSVAQRISWGLVAVAIIIYLSFASQYQPRFAKPAQVKIQKIKGSPALFLRSHAPAYSETAFGQKQQPLGIIFIARDKTNLQKAFQKSGWYKPQQADIQNLLTVLQSGEVSPYAPLAPAFWNNQINTLAFEKALETPGGKHALTVQIWETPYATHQGRIFVAIAKTFDGVHWGVMRTIDPDLDASRNAVVASFRAANLLKNTRLSPYLPSIVGQTLTGNSFFSRGQIQLVELKTQDNMKNNSDTNTPYNKQ